MAFPVVFKIGAIVVNTVTKHMAAGLKTFAEEGSFTAKSRQRNIRSVFTRRREPQTARGTHRSATRLWTPAC